MAQQPVPKQLQPATIDLRNYTGRNLPSLLGAKKPEADDDEASDDDSELEDDEDDGLDELVDDDEELDDDLDASEVDE